MTLKHLSVLSLIVMLSGCSLLPGNKEDFGSLYKDHVQSQIESLRELGKDLGYMESYSTEGSLRMLANIPAIFSGSFSAGYDASVEGQDVLMNLLSPKMSYETLLASGSLEAKTLSLISKGSDAYFQYSGLITSLGLIEPEVIEVLSKYSNTWLAIKGSELESTLSGASEEDILAYKISDALSKMTLTDIEKYLTTYPLWNAKNDLGMSGALHFYEVELSKNNIAMMMNEFTKDATGNEMTEEAKTELEASLSGVNLTGTLGLHPKNSEEISFVGVLSFAEGTNINLSLVSNNEKTWLMAKDENGGFEFTVTNTENGKNFLLSVNQGTKEVATLNGDIVINKDELQSLTLEFEAIEQGLTLTLEHKNDGNGGFDGRLNAGVGSISWKGKVKDKKELESFEMNAAMMGSSMELKLPANPSGMLTGPLIVKSGDATVLSAEIGLRAREGEFTLKVDIASPDEPTLRSQAEMSITSKRTEGAKTIEIPKEAKSFQEFVDALNAVMPTYDPMMDYDIETSTEDNSLDYDPGIPDESVVDQALIESMNTPIQ